MDCDIFQDEEFEPAAVTERPQPSESMDKDLDSSNITTNTQSKAAKDLTLPNIQACLSTPSTSQAAIATSSGAGHTPDQIIPLPHIGPRSTSKVTVRKKVKVAILTDTPEKKRLEEEHAQRQSKKKGASKPRLGKQPKTKKRKVKVPDSDSDENDDVVPLESDSESCSESAEEVEEGIKAGDFVLVRYKLEKKREQFYVGEVETVCDEEVTCSFLQKKSGDGLFFVYPDKADVDTIPSTDIVLHLGKPKQSGSSGRALKYLSFGIDFSKYNVM